MRTRLPKPCAAVQKRLEEYVDGGLCSAERLRLEAHLDACPACAEQHRLARLLRQALRELPRRQLDEAFETGLQERIRRCGAVSPFSALLERLRLRWEWRLRVPATLAAGSCAAGLLAAAVAPRVLEYQETQLERRTFVAQVAQRHLELESPAPVNWDAVDASLNLSAGVFAD